jgi:hypothetical protein
MSKKKTFFFILLQILPILFFGQMGVKAGFNFAKVSNASEISSSNNSGFHAGVFFAPSSKSMFSSQTELLFSRQGYDYKNATVTGAVDMDYLQLGQFLSINFTKFFSVLFGGQMSYLLNAKVDSTGGAGGTSQNEIMDLYNRIDYGYGIGVEVHPIMGLVIGARYNVSLSKIYKDIQMAQPPSFTSEDAKNNVVHISVGWKFAGKK